MVSVEGGEAVLGRYRYRYESDQVPPVSVDLEPFCVAIHPFPGRPGDSYPEDGLEAGDLWLWEHLLHSYGRRLCTVEELVWSLASGVENLPFSQGQGRSPFCEPDSSWGDMDPLGRWANCRNRLGLQDMETLSSWAQASEDVDDARGAQRRRPWVVVGGTNRPDTFYAPTNFGLHAHDPGDPAFFDDQLRVCADPGWSREAEWAVFQEAAAAQGSFGGALRWWWAHGTEASALEVLDDHVVYLRDD
jgi:hypothetical protein